MRRCVEVCEYVPQCTTIAWCNEDGFCESYERCVQFGGAVTVSSHRIGDPCETSHEC